MGVPDLGEPERHWLADAPPQVPGSRGLVRVWLDDQINDPETPPRHPPPGWVGVATAMAACRLLARGGVTHVSLDHDLGDGQMTGYTVARFIEKRAHEGRLEPLQWAVHSANPVGAAKMRQALLSADRAWRTG